jgi:hypothetical protein
MYNFTFLCWGESMVRHEELLQAKRNVIESMFRLMHAMKQVDEEKKLKRSDENYPCKFDDDTVLSDYYTSHERSFTGDFNNITSWNRMGSGARFFSEYSLNTSHDYINGRRDWNQSGRSFLPDIFSPHLSSGTYRRCQNLNICAAERQEIDEALDTFKGLNSGDAVWNPRFNFSEQDASYLLKEFLISLGSNLLITLLLVLLNAPPLVVWMMICLNAAVIMPINTTPEEPERFNPDIGFFGPTIIDKAFTEDELYQRADFV